MVNVFPMKILIIRTGEEKIITKVEDIPSEPYKVILSPYLGEVI